MNAAVERTAKRAAESLLSDLTAEHHKSVDFDDLQGGERVARRNA